MSVQSLTVYNDGSALIKERRSFDLAAGVNTVQFTDVPETIDSTSLIFASLTDGTVVLEQSFHYDLVDGDTLLRRFLDQTIEVTLEDGTRLVGDLMAQGRGADLILRLPDGQLEMIRDSQIAHIRLPKLPSGLMSRPLLRWLIQSRQTGAQDVDVTYLAYGISWSADYNVLLALGNESLNLNGWVTLNNDCGMTFDNVQIKLVAGDITRARRSTVMMHKLNANSQFSPRAGGVEQREVFEYNLYEIKHPVTVTNRESKQIEFVAGQKVPARVYYIYDASQNVGAEVWGAWDTQVKLIQNWLEFSTAKEDELGADLPAGRMRVYQEDIDGAALLIGESQIQHTPEGETIRFRLGAAFDLVGERKQIQEKHLTLDELQERYEIRLRNRKDAQTVEIQVPERLFRGGEWEIVEASSNYTQTDSHTIEFRVTVPPGGESVISYTVLYRNLKPD